MFYVVDSSLDDAIAIQRADICDFLDMAILAHKMGHIILVLSRFQMRALENGSRLSYTSRRALSYISTKSNDYRAALAIASRRIVIVDRSETENFFINGRDIRVSFNFIKTDHLLYQKIFLGENITDIKFMSFLGDMYFDEIRYPRNYVKFKPIGGGGSTLHHSLHAEPISPVKGLVVCDADVCHPRPPFKKHSTADHAYATAKTMLLLDHRIGMSEISPFFGLYATWGRSIENYVSPRLLDTYFDAQGRTEVRRTFVEAFPSFPILNHDEWFFWQHLNLKDKTPDLTEQLNEYKRERGSVHPSLVGKLEALAKLSIPGDVIGWLLDHSAASRWSAAIKSAFKLDLRNLNYANSLSDVANAMLNLCAGDGSASRL